MNRLRRLWHQHDWIRRTVRTFGQVFITLFLVSLIGWFGDVQEWATNGGQFPDPSALGKAAVAAFAAGCVAAITGLQNWLEDRGVIRARK